MRSYSTKVAITVIMQNSGSPNAKNTLKTLVRHSIAIKANILKLADSPPHPHPLNRQVLKRFIIG